MTRVDVDQLSEANKKPPLDGDDAIAAEYVLGLLTSDELQAFEARLVSDSDLQQDVAAWRAYFVTFTETLPDKSPPDTLRNLVEQGISAKNRKPVWRQLVPYAIGAVIGAILTWLVQSTLN